ncbi:MAG: AarF/ABC1/UbiB kinase family protein [bacterium]
MLKPHWVPTPLVTQRARPEIKPLRRPHRFRAVMLATLWSGALLHLLWLRITGRATSEARALVIRQLLERLGGVWIKVGQLLGMRRDLFSGEFCDVLSALQDHATGFAFEHTRRAIEGELGGPIDRFFSEFEEAPFAAASIGQIHRARLRRGGTLVAVKIRRPYIARMVRGDIRFVEVLCRVAMALRIFSFFRWDDFHHELERTLGEELDYRFEATNIRDMRRNLKDHGIYAPKVFTRLCSERVLVMEFITGALMSDVLRLRHVDPTRLQHWLAENGIQMKTVGRCLFESLMRQIFEDNYFHGDLHPGNIVLLRDSRIALIDFGSVGWLEADFLAQYDKMQDAMAHQQYAKASDLMLLLGPELPPIDLEPCKRELVAFMRAWALRARTPGMPYSRSRWVMR